MFVLFYIPLRQYEDRELRVARERDRKRLEFTNQLQRINNQLEYERSRDTEGLFGSGCFNMYFIYVFF